MPPAFKQGAKAAKKTAAASGTATRRDYNNKLGGAYCIYNNNIVLAHLALVIPDGLANGTLLATFPNGVNLKTSLGIGVSSATGAISTINAINNCIYSAGSMHTGNYILDMVFKRA